MLSRRKLVLFLTILTIALLALTGCVPPWSAPRGALPDMSSLPARQMSDVEQAAQAIAGLLIKPTYMLLSLLIIVALFGQAPGDLRALQWGQIAFLVGETFCAVNFYIYNHQSLLSEYLHSFGMVIAFGLTIYAVAEALDVRLLKLTSSRGACAAIGLCGRCTRHDAVGCRARQLGLLMLPVLAVVGAIPLLAPLVPQAYSVTVLGFPYSYARLEPYEFIERRLLPILAITLLFAAWLPLLRKGEPPVPGITKGLASAGLGALGFCLLRVFLSSLFVRDLVWFEFWEEATELIFVGCVALALWHLRQAFLAPTPVLEAMGVLHTHG